MTLRTFVSRAVTVGAMALALTAFGVADAAARTLEEEHPGVESNQGRIQALWTEALGREVHITLHCCPPGDERLTGETVFEWRERLKAERAEARRQAAEADPLVQAALNVLGGEILHIHPR